VARPRETAPADPATGADSIATTLLARTTALWLVAVLFYGVGDTATTLVGADTGHVAEAGPVVAGVLGYAGTTGLLTVKLLSFAGFYLAWRLLPPPGRAGVPLALSVVGVAVTVWNLLVLLPPGLLR
jgi:hypothetical protein